jgi:hypothetical protein
MTTQSDPFGFLAAINWDVVDAHAEEISQIFEAEVEEDKPVAVIDMESASKPGEEYTVLARFWHVAEAESWIDHHEDTAKVERGGFGIDAPEDEPCCYNSTRNFGTGEHEWGCPNY